MLVVKVTDPVRVQLLRRVALTAALFTSTVVVWLVTIAGTGSRLVLVTLGAATLMMVVRLAWLGRIARVVVILCATIALSFLALPGRAVNVRELREDYVCELRRLEGVRYGWGGESRTRLDCSGLVRRALVTALARHGVRTLNPGPVRSAMSLWWRDE